MFVLCLAVCFGALDRSQKRRRMLDHFCPLHAGPVSDRLDGSLYNEEGLLFISFLFIYIIVRGREGGNHARTGPPLNGIFCPDWIKWAGIPEERDGLLTKHSITAITAI